MAEQIQANLVSIDQLTADEAVDLIHEAQDFKEEWAKALLLFLKDRGKSRLGVFYDEVQVLRNNSFGNGFGKNRTLFYLNENIRNTSNDRKRWI